MSDALQVAQRLVEEARRAGAQDAEAMVEDERELQVRVHAGSIDFIKEAHSRGGGLRVFLDGKQGFVYSSDFRAEALADLARRAVTLARFGLADEFAALPEADWLAAGSDTTLELFDPAVPELTTETCIARSLAMERAALGVDARVKRTQGCGMTRVHGTRALANTRGASLAYDSTAVGLFVTALAEDEGGKQQGWGEGGSYRHASQLPAPEAVGAKAGREAVRRLGPRKVATQEVPVVMHPDVVEGWLGRVASAFAGDEVFKKTSYLTDKLGQTIAAKQVTLVNDGRRKRGIASAPFDGEGVATRRTALIDQGVCSAFLYDAYTARQAGTTPTGSAQRSYAGVPGIGPHNLFLEPREASLEDLLRPVQQGFYYVDSGSFGYNPTTGDYAFQAAGFWIEQGAIAYPVDEITVGSTTLDMLANIEAIGRDVDWRGAVSCPALRLAAMTVSG